MPQLVSGTGGRDLRTGTFTEFPFVAAGFSASSTTSPTGHLSENGFSLIDVTQTELTVKYIAADDGAIIDCVYHYQAAPIATDTVTFQQGLHGYSGTVDTYVALTNSGVSNASAPSLNVDSADPSGNPTQALLRFSNLFGTGSGQIPPNATITSACIKSLRHEQ